MRSSSTLVRLVIASASILAVACRAEPDAIDTTAASVPFECEVQAYPCTWNEVAPEIVTQTKMLAELGALYEKSGASLGDVAAFLRDQPQVQYVDAIGTGVRFRLENGRPAWVYPGNELDHHRGAATRGAARGFEESVNPRPAPATRAPASLLGSLPQWLNPRVHAQEQATVGVAADEPGTGKRALILAPFEWEYPGHGYTAAEGAEKIRDYTPAAGGEVVYKADLAEFEANPTGPHHYVDGEVQFKDFLEWDTYNLVVLLSHGTLHLCHLTAPVGGARRIKGEMPNQFDLCPLIWAGRAKQESYGAHIGVEIVEYVKPMHEPHPGLTANEARYCRQMLTAHAAAGNSGAAEPQTAGGKPCRVQTADREREGERLALWTDFFRAEYPKGLQNAVVMLAACRSGVDNTLLDILAPEGNKNVSIFGFANAVDAGEGLGLATELVRLLGKGIHSHDLEELLRGLDLTGALVGKTLDLGDEDPAGPAELRTALPTATHGRDIVLLVDPVTGHELQNGGSVHVTIRGADQAAQLQVHPQLLGVTSDQPSPDQRLQVRVVGEEIPNVAYRPETLVDEYAYRYQRPVALGRGYQDGEIVDLEVRTELPGGGLSRWVYKNIRLTSCYWRGEMTGTFARPIGGYGVSVGGLTLPGPAEGDDSQVISTIALGRAPGHPPADGLSLVAGGELATGTFSFALGANSGAYGLIATREVPGPFIPLTRGQFQITLNEPGKMVVGGFAVAYKGLALPDFGNADLELRGEFVWTPACPTVWDHMMERGGAVAAFVEEHGIQ